MGFCLLSFCLFVFVVAGTAQSGVTKTHGAPGLALGAPFLVAFPLVVVLASSDALAFLQDCFFASSILRKCGQMSSVGIHMNIVRTVPMLESSARFDVW